MIDFNAKSCEALKNVATVSAGYPFRGGVDSMPAGDVAVLQMRNIDINDGIRWSDVQRITLPSKREPALLKTGDVIFTTRGSRNFALALNELPGRVVCSPHFFVLRPVEPNLLSAEFLAWQINQRPAQEYFQREATGSHILNIKRDAIEGLEIAIPPIAAQHRIVALAEAARVEHHMLNRLIDNRNRQLEAIALGLVSSERRIT
jgi:Type I restriction modification DNA specificity domain